MGWPSFAPFQPAKTSAIACRIVASGASTLVPAPDRPAVQETCDLADDRARRQRRDRQIFQPGHDGQPHRQAVAHHGTDGAAAALRTELMDDSRPLTALWMPLTMPRTTDKCR